MAKVSSPKSRLVVTADAYEGPRRPTVAAPGVPEHRAGLMAHATRITLEVLERIAKLMTFNAYEGATIDVDVDGHRLALGVAREVGQGVFGVVHRLEPRVFPETLTKLFDDDGAPRTDLVIKLPNRVPLPIPRSLNPWVINLNTEITDEIRFLEALRGDERLPGPRILHAQRGSRPFVIKPFAVGADLRTLGQAQPCLTSDQRASLRVLFDTARGLHERIGVALDLKAENLIWDAESKTMGLYELSSISPLVSGFFTARGFDAYADYAEAHMRTGHRTQTCSEAEHRGIARNG